MSSGHGIWSTYVKVVDWLARAPSGAMTIISLYFGANLHNVRGVRKLFKLSGDYELIKSFSIYQHAQRMIKGVLCILPPLSLYLSHSLYVSRSCTLGICAERALRCSLLPHAHTHMYAFTNTSRSVLSHLISSSRNFKLNTNIAYRSNV